MNKKYIIFDFDGTLCNTNDIIVESWQATFEHFLGHTLPRRDIEATFGETLVSTIARLIPGVEVNDVVDYYRSYQDANQQGKVHVFNGVRDLVTELRTRGCLIGVATSRTAYSFWNYMKQFGMEDLVDEVVTMNDVTHHKPHPESITAVLEKLVAFERVAKTKHFDTNGFASNSGPQTVTQNEALHTFASSDPVNNSGSQTSAQNDIVLTREVLDQAIMIGDTKYDVGCANNAGVDSVLVGWSHYIDQEDMSASGFNATYWIDKPADLLEII